MDCRVVLERIVRDGFILVFNQDGLDVVRTAAALQEAGIGQMEVTCRISEPAVKIERLRRELPEFTVGAASLVDYDRFLARYNTRHMEDPLPTVAQAFDAGAQYLVSAANFAANTYGRFGGKLPIIPGCGTASEVLGQYDLGANMCKLFPAKQLGGAAFVKAFDPAAHKLAPLVPTGGTAVEDLAEYVGAGVFVLGGSFSMLDKAVLGRILEERDYVELGRQFGAIKGRIDELRAAKWPGLDWARVTLDEVERATGRDFNV